MLDSLSKTLNVLFHETDAEKVIDLFLQGKSADIEVDGDYFVKVLQSKCLSFTMDQDRHLYDVLDTKWMKSRKDTNLCYSKSKTIFNALLHYGEDVIIIRDGYPCCRFEYLLRFHELTTLIQEDTVTCAYCASWSLMNNTKVQDFEWPLHIRHDFKELNDLLERNLSDIHFHLKGSSANFDLNWLCLMNYVCSLRENGILSVLGNKFGEEFVRLALIAAGIRLYLFSLYSGNNYFDYKDLKQIISSDVLSIDYNKINSRLSRALSKSYLNDYFNKHIDYALTTLGMGVNLSRMNRIESVFSGERWLLCSAFKDVYGSNSASTNTVLLYIYLLIKNKFYHLLVQTNDSIGFANFNQYEQLKDIFVEKIDVYKALLPFVAIGNFVGEYPKKRYVEVRIAPKDNYCDFCKAINDLYDDKAKKSLGWNAEQWKYDILLHFIKEPENPELIIGQERHFHLREKVREQTEIIIRYRNEHRNSQSSDYQNIIGIDAANSELYARPEVFAVAFRCLRNHSLEFPKKQDLRMTYHVGEDFHDLVDGLRAIDEVLIYMEFGNGDRLGHALSLGTEVSPYYENRKYAIAIPKQILLDNFAWMLFKLKRLGRCLPLQSFIENEFETYFAEIFGVDVSSKYSINDYYQSWLLRGDSPNCYSCNGLDKIDKVSVNHWQAAAFCEDKEVNKARKHKKATILNYLYQFDHDVRKKGRDSDLFEIDENWQKAWIEAISLIQKELWEKVRKREIHIECNPTSNRKIGEMNQYIDHPIFKFHGIHPSGKDLSVSINTDDAGVFATSLEREYSLLARAYMKMYDKDINVKKDVIKWLDSIRKEGIKASFNNAFREEENECYEKIPKQREPRLGFWGRFFNNIRQLLFLKGV